MESRNKNRKTHEKYKLIYEGCRIMSGIISGIQGIQTPVLSTANMGYKGDFIIGLKPMIQGRDLIVDRYQDNFFAQGEFRKALFYVMQDVHNVSSV